MTSFCHDWFLPLGSWLYSLQLVPTMALVKNTETDILDLEELSITSLRISAFELISIGTAFFTSFDEVRAESSFGVVPPVLQSLEPARKEVELLVLFVKDYVEPYSMLRPMISDRRQTVFLLIASCISQLKHLTVHLWNKEIPLSLALHQHFLALNNRIKGIECSTEVLRTHTRELKQLLEYWYCWQPGPQSARPLALKPLSMVPKLACHHFAGRELELTTTHSRLCDRGQLAVLGVRGIGYLPDISHASRLWEPY